jgi:hypothetical protein
VDHLVALHVVKRRGLDAPAGHELLAAQDVVDPMAGHHSGLHAYRDLGALALRHLR